MGSGGVGVLISNSFLNNYAVLSVDKQHEDILVIFLEHKMSKFQILLRAVYLPPSNSPYGRDPEGFFDRLLSSAYYFEPHLSIAVGDCNARIGSLDDTAGGSVALSERHIADNAVNAHGTHFITYLNYAGDCVVNGRVSPHLNNFTNVSVANKGGSSVVDYITCNYDGLNY